jgi:membrane peptidoglycan carboxypeptidase
MNPPRISVNNTAPAPSEGVLPAVRGPDRLSVRFTLSKALGTALAVLLAFHAALLLIAGALSLLYSFLNPPLTTLMLYRRLANGYPSHPMRYVPLDRVPRYAQRMFIQVEDYTFYRNPGIDLKAILDAYRINRRLGQIYYGGSTITQQLARTLFLTPRRTYLRKYAEALIALEMDLLLGKRRILELYVNYIELGRGIYGVGAAAEYHFGKPAAGLDLDEYRRLVTIVASPLRYTMASFSSRRALSERYNYLLQAFPDLLTAPPPETPPPPEVQSQDALEADSAPGPETTQAEGAQEPEAGQPAGDRPEAAQPEAAPASGGRVQTGIVVPEAEARKTLPEPVHQGANP